jgi:bacillopeptidase F
MRRLVLFSLFFCILISWTTANAQVAKITPELQETLRSSQPDNEVSVIVILSDKVDLNLFKMTKNENKSLHRSRIVNALRDKAELTQGPLRFFLEKSGAKNIKNLWIINGLSVTVPASLIDEIAAQPVVESVRLDSVIKAPVMTAGFPTVSEWNLTLIRAPELWNLGYTGTGVVVANLDTGVDINHPDLQSQWRGGTNSWFNPYSDPLNASNCRTPNQCSPCELSSNTPCDTDGHGTGTMGVMVGGSAGGTAIGVAPDATWIAVKIFSDAGDSYYSIIHEGFQWLLNPDGNAPTQDAPDVVNASWVVDLIDGCDLQFQPDIRALKAAGIAVAFSAGNYGPNHSTSISPANNPESFAVGAVDQSQTIASFSSRGPSACDGNIYPEVVAPGVNIKTSDLTFGGVFPDSYAYVSGTSFAAPHVAGAMALLLSAFPDLTVSELELILKNSALDLGAIGADNAYGYGLIDVLAAYYLAQNPAIAVYPSSHNFGKIKEGLFSSPQNFTVTNQGLKDLIVDATSILGTNSSEFLILTDTCSGQVVVSAGSCDIQVLFAPTSGGLKTAELLISSNDLNQNPFYVTLNGKGIERYNLGVTTAGTGAGRVISDPLGIDCGTDCSQLFGKGAVVTLQAVPEGDSGFGGWSGCNWSSGRTCQVTMGRDKIVTGTFIAPSLTLTSPNGGERLKAGTYKRIKWTFTGRPGPYVRIELLQGDTVVITITNKAAKGIYGKGHFDWLIPGKLPPGPDYKILITSTKNSAYTDTSNAPFTIMK